MRVFWPRDSNLVSVLVLLCFLVCSAGLQAQQIVQTTQANPAPAKSFSIASEANSSWLVLAHGKAHFVQNEQGLMITFDALDLQLNGSDSEPIFVSSVLISGQELDPQTGRRTQLMRSERLPVRQTLSADHVLHLDGQQAIYMRYPNWQQTNPRFYLSVEFSQAKQEGSVDIPTDLNRYPFKSDFSNSSNLRSRPRIVTWPGVAVMIFPMVLMGIYFLRHARKRIHGLAFSILFAGLWMVGIFPCLRVVYSQTWKETPAYIVDFDVRSFAPSTEVRPHQYLPLVKYEYQIDGNTRIGTQVHLGPSQLRSSVFDASDEAEQWRAPLIEGTPMRAWINPWSEDDVVLERRVPTAVVLIALFGSLLLGLMWQFYRRRSLPSQGRSN